MSQQSNSAFVRAFLPGLVLGLVVGGFAGAFLSSGAGIAALWRSRDEQPPFIPHPGPRDEVPTAEPVVEESTPAAADPSHERGEPGRDKPQEKPKEPPVPADPGAAPSNPVPEIGVEPK